MTQAAALAISAPTQVTVLPAPGTDSDTTLALRAQASTVHRPAHLTGIGPRHSTEIGEGTGTGA
jgi:hypothetical protein